MIRVLYRHRSGAIIPDLPIEQVPGAVRDPAARVWIDLEAPTIEEQRQILERTFKFHPLAVEDAITEVHVPKVDEYGSHLYLVFHTLKLGSERMDIDTFEIDIFLGTNYLITLHQHVSDNINKMWHADYHNERGLANSPARLLYELLDRQIDGYIPLLDEFEARIEQMGDLIFMSERNNDRAILNDILTAKSSALRLHRILIPQREVLAQLAHSDLVSIPTESRLYFQDLYDHLQRLADLADSMRSLVDSTMTTHLTLASNRLNEVMKVLTIISTIFIPLNFIAAVYGMNFDFMPELHWRWAYSVVWLFFIALAGVMLYIFRRRHWL